MLTKNSFIIISYYQYDSYICWNKVDNELKVNTFYTKNNFVRHIVGGTIGLAPNSATIVTLLLHVCIITCVENKLFLIAFCLYYAHLGEFSCISDLVVEFGGCSIVLISHWYHDTATHCWWLMQTALNIYICSLTCHFLPYFFLCHLMLCYVICMKIHNILLTIIINQYKFKNRVLYHWFFDVGLSQ